MKSNFKIEGIHTAFITPFEKDNITVKTDVVKQLVEAQIYAGVDGFYVLGATGEGLVMSREAREEMCEAAVKAIAGRKPMICHIAAMILNEAVELARHAERTGADAIAAVPPCFFSYTTDDLFNYYKKLADSVSIPVIIYYHPSAQKDMSAELIAHIFEIDNVTGVKWSSANMLEMMKLKDLTKGDMNIINGPDELLVCGLASGADAGIGSTYNVMLPDFVALYKEFRDGNIDAARSRQYRINRVISVICRYGVIPSVKYASVLSGFDVGDATFPMTSFNDGVKAAFSHDMINAGWNPGGYVK